jgi:hypothetical protein
MKNNIDWDSIGFLNNVKNKTNLIIAFDYCFEKTYYLYDKDYISLYRILSIDTIIFSLVRSIFSNFTINLNEHFIKNKIDQIINDFEMEREKFLNLTNGIEYHTELDRENEFYTYLRRKYYFNIIL